MIENKIFIELLIDIQIYKWKGLVVFKEGEFKDFLIMNKIVVKFVIK